MSKFELHRFDADDDVAAAVANRWLTEAGSIRSVALSGGRIARKLFSAVTKSRAAAEKLSTVHFFWADERCVPPTDPESNFGIAGELLFAPLQIPGDRIHRIKGEDPPSQAAAEAEAELRRTVPGNPEKQPVLDLVLLGMGEDGHVASLFPSELIEFLHDNSVYRPVTAPKPPPRRVTVGYKPIFAAKQVWVLASGAGKEEALRESISPEGATPLARVLQNRIATAIFTDVQLDNEFARRKVV